MANLRRWTLLAILGLIVFAIPGFAQEGGLSEQWADFTMDDSEFAVQAPTTPIEIERGPKRFLWSCGTLRASCVVGYTVISDPGASKAWKKILNDYTDGVAKSLNIKVQSRKPLSIGIHIGVDIVGTVYVASEKAWKQARIRTFTGSGCDRIYLVTGSGDIDLQRFVSSFHVK